MIFCLCVVLPYVFIMIVSLSSTQIFPQEGLASIDAIVSLIFFKKTFAYLVFSAILFCYYQGYRGTAYQHCQSTASSGLFFFFLFQLDRIERLRGEKVKWGRVRDICRPTSSHVKCTSWRCRVGAQTLVHVCLCA